jgi:hypothetical protein
MVRRAAFLGAALLAALLPACRDEAAEDGEDPPAAEAGKDGAEVAPVRKFPAAPSGGLREPARMVITDPVVWEATWAKANSHLAPVPKAPRVDFAKEMVALAALGEKPTAGWSVEIVGARREGGRLRILYAERGPPKDAVAAAVITRPWHAVVLPRETLPAEWVPYQAPGAGK